ncbi:MAG: TRAP transporter substrate-binding protein DctP [Pseudomonadota bacterium]
MNRLLAAALTATLTTPVLAEETLTAVHAFPESLIYTQSFLEFVENVNSAGEGIVQIEVRGGPEAIGMFQQPDAVRDGIVDMVYTPGSFYAGTVPEKDALVASNLTAVETRANGGIDLYNQIHQEKMGVYFLGWFDSNVSYNLWFVNEPQLDAGGNLSVEGVKLRGNPVYNAFFTNYLGASVIDLPTTDVYAGLERGVVDATGWTQIGLSNLKWNDFINYRVEPNFFSTDLGVIVNLDKWNSLSQEAKDILQTEAIAHETSSAQKLGGMRDAEFAELEAGGMQVVTLEGEAAANYLKAARDTTWARMKEQMDQHPSGSANYNTLIELFYDFDKAGQ